MGREALEESVARLHRAHERESGDTSLARADWGNVPYWAIPYYAVEGVFMEGTRSLRRAACLACVPFP